jgi:hypothetical protein
MPETKEQKKKRLEEELAELTEKEQDLKDEEKETKKEAKETSDPEEKKELNRQASAVAADAGSVHTLIELSEALLKKLGATDEEVKTIKAKAKARNRW